MGGTSRSSKNSHSKSKSPTPQQDSNADAASALSARLRSFRNWLREDADCTVHPALCIVNGEATDGTKNAPVLVLPSAGSADSTATGRIGTVDSAEDQALYDRTLGCQLRAVREIRKDEVILEMPKSAMVTPDLVASTDAGRAILACCKAPSIKGETSKDGNGERDYSFWDAFENTTLCEQKFQPKVARHSGPQLLVKILQECATVY